MSGRMNATKSPKTRRVHQIKWATKQIYCKEIQANKHEIETT